MIKAATHSTCSDEACSDSTAPRWMNRILLAAGIYNLVWGAIAILFPNAIFQWAGFQPLPNYPQLWQCIGMIVGVYGVGYAIAAFDPYRHWPIVLVGLLGKIFGPIGFVQAVWSGDFPLTMGWTIVTNDLIWWVPFTVILWNAARVNQLPSRIVGRGVTSASADPLNEILSQRGVSLTDLSSERPTLVVFLRHAGCTFCREAVADLADARDAIEGRGTQIAVVHMGATDILALLKRHALDDVHAFHDPQEELYDAFDLRLASFRQVLGLRVWLRGIAAFLRGHGIGRLEGNGFRMSGAFLLCDGKTVNAFRQEIAADRPDYVQLATMSLSSDRLRIDTAQAIAKS